MSNGSSLIVPLAAVPAQTLRIDLGTPPQPITINLYAKEIEVPVLAPSQIATEPPVYEPITPLFIDIYLNDALVIGGVICENNNLIIKNNYFGVIGDFSFWDSQGSDDPQYTGLGSRWYLCYWENLP
jgi:hypothetical protein